MGDWLFRKDSGAQDVERYWRAVELELGERVECHSIAEVLSGWDVSRQNAWFLIFATASALHFRRESRAHWLQAMLGGGAQPEQEQRYSIPWSCIVSVTRKERSGNRLIAALGRRLGDDPGVSVRYVTSAGEEREVGLRLGLNQDALLSTARSLIARRTTHHAEQDERS